MIGCACSMDGEMRNTHKTWTKQFTSWRTIHLHTLIVAHMVMTFTFSATRKFINYKQNSQSHAPSTLTTRYSHVLFNSQSPSVRVCMIMWYRSASSPTRATCRAYRILLQLSRPGESIHCHTHTHRWQRTRSYYSRTQQKAIFNTKQHTATNISRLSQRLARPRGATHVQWLWCK